VISLGNHLLPSADELVHTFAIHLTTEKGSWPEQPAHFTSEARRLQWLRDNALLVDERNFTFYNTFHATTAANTRAFSLVASDCFRNVPRFDCALIRSDDSSSPFIAQILSWFRYIDGLDNTFCGAFVQYFPRISHPSTRGRHAYRLQESYQRLTVGEYGCVDLGSVIAPAAVYPNFDKPQVSRSTTDIRSSLLSSQYSEFFLCNKLFASNKLLL
jgi:hypothetical protein